MEHITLSPIDMELFNTKEEVKYFPVITFKPTKASMMHNFAGYILQDDKENIYLLSIGMASSLQLELHNIPEVSDDIRIKIELGLKK